jgi:hypothetical protein
MWKAIARLTIVCVSLLITSLMFIDLSYAKIDPKSVAGMWFFNEGKGKIAEDFSGNGNGGNITGNPKWVDGKFGKALEFNGVNDYVDIGAGKFDTIADGTIALCFNHRGTAGDNRVIFGHTKDGSNRSPIFVNNGSQKITYEMIVGGVNHGLSSDNVVVAGTWYYFAVTFGKGGMKMYVDGVQQAATDPNEGGYDDIGTSSENMMCRHLGGFHLPGTVDEAAIFNVVLEKEDIQAIMNQGLERALGITAVYPTGKLATTWAKVKSQDRVNP